MAVSFIAFFAMYVLTGTLIRLLTLKFPDSALTKPLMFCH